MLEINKGDVNMVYGYARVSTGKQKIERQVQNILRAYPDAIIFQESFTGRSLSRPEWMRLNKLLVRGDVVVFDEVSRMSRNAEEGIVVYQELFHRGVELIFLKEPQISTATYKKALTKTVTMTGTAVDYILEGINHYLLAVATEQIKLAFSQAEKEVEFLRRRTVEGLRQAKANGVQLGQPLGNTYETKKGKKAKEIILKHAKVFGGSLTDTEVMALCGCSRPSYYKYKQELLSA